MRMPAIAEDIYPSRKSEAPGIEARKDPVVYSDPTRPPKGLLTEKQLADFDRKGFLFLPNYLSIDQVDACRAELERVRTSDEIKRRPEAVVEPECNSLRSLFSVHKLSPFFGQVASDERMISAVMQILDSQVYIHQARVNLKPGFVGKEFYWHSDFETWHVEDGMPRMRAVSCSILLTENDPFNGPLMLVPGSHRKFIPCVGQAPEDHYKQSLKRQEFGVPDTDSVTALVEESTIEAPTGPAGSLLIFDCNTMHGSNSNISPYPRSNLFFVYNSVENRLREPYSGQKPRPEFIACRDENEVITPIPVNYKSAM